MFNCTKNQTSGKLCVIPVSPWTKVSFVYVLFYNGFVVLHHNKNIKTFAMYVINKQLSYHKAHYVLFQN